MRTVEIRGDSCVMLVEGFTMPCPLCRTLVRSGQRHVCQGVPPKVRRPRREKPEAAK